MTSKKPPPLLISRTHGPCPVCGQTSYSPAGIHPQCAVRQMDAKRLQRLKRERPPQVKVRTKSDVKPWQKVCGKCQRLQHIRKKTCDCGQVFADRSRSASSESETS